MEGYTPKIRVVTPGERTQLHCVQKTEEEVILHVKFFYSTFQNHNTNTFLHYVII